MAKRWSTVKLTLAMANSLLYDHGLRIRKTDAGDYRTHKMGLEPKREEETADYQDSLQDAFDTALANLRRGAW